MPRVWYHISAAMCTTSSAGPNVTYQFSDSLHMISVAAVQCCNKFVARSTMNCLWYQFSDAISTIQAMLIVWCQFSDDTVKWCDVCGSCPAMLWVLYQFINQCVCYLFSDAKPVSDTMNVVAVPRCFVWAASLAMLLICVLPVQWCYCYVWDSGLAMPPRSTLPWVCG